jgi:uncharacterized membrane protein (UPF0136 family)
MVSLAAAITLAMLCLFGGILAVLYAGSEPWIFFTYVALAQPGRRK